MVRCIACMYVWMLSFFHAIKYFILGYDVIEGGDDIFLDRLSNL